MFNWGIVCFCHSLNHSLSHSLTHSLSKYENRGALIPVEERTCLVCKEDCIEHKQHFLMYCRGYATLRRELHWHVSNVATHYNSLRWMVPVFRFFEYVNFERTEQKINSTSQQNWCMTRLQNLFSSKSENYFVTNCCHGNDTWWLFRPTFELPTLISRKLTWWPPIFFTLVFLSFENETTWSFKKISTKRIFYKRWKRQLINNEKFFS